MGEGKEHLDKIETLPLHSHLAGSEYRFSNKGYDYQVYAIWLRNDGRRLMSAAGEKKQHPRNVFLATRPDGGRWNGRIPD